MPTNFYFQPFPTGITQEQLLVEDLVIEAMQQYGMDVFYLPRSSADPNGPDTLYGEDTLKQYKVAFPIEVYLENVTGMDGEQDFISKFGLEIRDEITLLISRRRFKYASGATNYSIPRLGDLVINSGPKRPMEGDLIYIPLMQNFFEITFVEHENDQAMFYTLGRGRGGNVYVYALKLKQFVLSDELIQTGHTEIDEQAFDSYKRTRLDVPVNGTGKFTVGEFVYIIRKRIKLGPEQAMFIFTNNILPPTASSIYSIYQEHRDDDGFLYLVYSLENTFGSFNF